MCRFLLLLQLLLAVAQECHAMTVLPSGVVVADFRRDYVDVCIPHHHQPLWTKEALLQQLIAANDEQEDRKKNSSSKSSFFFERFQSPESILRLFDGFRCRKTSFHRHHHSGAKDGRNGFVSTTRLGGDWVLAESRQVAVNCTSQEVLATYLSGKLQAKWNHDKVLECHIHLVTPFAEKRNETSAATTTTTTIDDATQQDNGEPYYQQDLVLKSQRVIRSHTGIMRYSQKITIDKIGDNDDDDDTAEKYCVSIQLLDPSTHPGAAATTTTLRKPFDALSVYVNLEQHAENVHIYAAGLMKVNRQVVPNLLVFDASGIAGSMAGKGTLWLAAYFQQRQRQQQQQQQQQQSNQGEVAAEAASATQVRWKNRYSTNRMDATQLVAWRKIHAIPGLVCTSSSLQVLPDSSLSYSRESCVRGTY